MAQRHKRPSVTATGCGLIRTRGNVLINRNGSVLMGTGCLKTPFQVPSIRSQVRTFVARFPMPTLLFAGYLRDTMIMREAKEILYKLQK